MHLVWYFAGTLPKNICERPVCICPDLEDRVHGGRVVVPNLEGPLAELHGLAGRRLLPDVFPFPLRTERARLFDVRAGGPCALGPYDEQKGNVDLTLRQGWLLGGTACPTLGVYCSLVYFTRLSSCQGPAKCV